jgi:recombination protein RecA
MSHAVPSDAAGAAEPILPVDDADVVEVRVVIDDDALPFELAAPTPLSSPSKSSAKQSSTWRAALARLEALAGRSSVALFGTAEPPTLQRLSTGIADLDDALQGGLPCGRLVEIAGPAGIGKTSLALAICAAAQKRGAIAAFVDADHGLERSALHRVGVAADGLVIARPESGEQALHVVDELLRARAAEVIVVDSVAALVPAAELSGMTGTAPAGYLSRLMSQSVRRLTLQAARSRATVVFVNQFRRNWGEDGKGFDVTAGGNALVYAAATRLFITGDSSGVRVTLKKARFGHEGRVVRLPDLVRGS